MKNRLLHADDDPVFSGIVKRILHQGGFEVYNATDGEHAWSLFREMKFHYCLLDIMMPRLNGIDLGERIRNANSDIPIFYLSGEDRGIVEKDVFGRGGGHAYFNKTFKLSELSAMLHESLQIKVY
ncbi:response regulator [Chitinophaga arvensicola]|uniref:Response regulator receiver domain-containing protein n=1 Tax=Chitinophaga arvensicola TaxID=29529 RepID=A0A1I0PSF3_9BACT|nr:response regulator [Chitinophaga arvensicola]SEW17306.1 Response regulator receiver domain-containing protein [Chitinophaga arvensicola]